MGLYESELLKQRPALERLARSLVADEHLAGDLVQDAWVSALRRGDDPPAQPGAWMQTVVRRALWTRSRDRARREARERAVAALREEPTPEELFVRRDVLEQVTAAVDALPELYRTVVRMRYWDDLTPTAIARLLDRPVETVQTQLRRGLSRLRERLDAEHAGDRRAWCLPLVALRLPERRAPPWPLGLGAAAAVALLAAGTWLGLRRDGAPAELPVLAHAPEAGDDPELWAPAPADRSARPLQEAPRQEPESPTESPQSIGHRLRIEVVDAAGAPVEGAELVLRRGSEYFARARTSAEGTLDLTFAAVDTEQIYTEAFGDHLTLFARKPGWVSSPGHMVQFRPGADDALRLELAHPGLTVNGRVVDGQGNPVEGALVLREHYAGQDRLAVREGIRQIHLSQARSDAGGYYELPGEAPGEAVVLRIECHGYLRQIAYLEAPVGGEVSVETVMRPAALVTGKVRNADGTPNPGAWVWFSDGKLMTPSPNDVVEVGADGSFRLSSLPPGRHVLWAIDPYEPQYVAWTELEVGATEPATWNPTLNAVEGIRLRLTDEDGAPLADWLVTLTQESADYRERVFLFSESDGTVEAFELRPDLPTEIHVRASYEVDPLPRLVLRDVFAAPEVRVLKVPTRSEPVGTVTLRLVSADGSVPTGSRVYLLPRGAGAETSAGLTPGGAARFDRVPDGDYELQVQWGRAGIIRSSFRMEGGQELDLGVLHEPPSGGVQFTVDPAAPAGWPPEDGAHEWLLIAGKVQLDGGPVPLPAARRLLPGEYGLLVRRDGQPVGLRKFTVEGGADVSVLVGPGGLD